VSFPKPRAIHWWRRGLEDGKAACRKRRGRFFPLYLEKATEALNPGELLGPFEVIYTRAFRVGWDNYADYRERANTFLPRPKKRGTLT